MDEKDLMQLWLKHKTGYKFKVLFEAQKPIMTIPISEMNLIIHSVRRSDWDRRYDPKYTVYIYSVNPDGVERRKSWDARSIVETKEISKNAAIWVKREMVPA